MRPSGPSAVRAAFLAEGGLCEGHWGDRRAELASEPGQRREKLAARPCGKGDWGKHAKARAAGRLRQSAFSLTISKDRGAQRERRNFMNVFEPFESWDNYTNAAVVVPCAGPACIFWGILCHLIL